VKKCKVCQHEKDEEEFVEGNICNLCRSANRSRLIQEAQMRTLPGSFRNGCPWEQVEELFILEHSDWTVEALAIHLHRTYEAVSTHKSSAGLLSRPRALLPVTEFRLCSNGGIQIITVERVERSLTVFCPNPVRLDGVKEAFLRQGHSQDLFDEWWNKTSVHGSVSVI
jgi:hypothetical protein